jgi:CheY-like chemotaxis protein
VRPLDILVVEDDDALAMFYEEALGDFGHHVHLARNGAEGLAALRPDLDLVITDVAMPVMRGDEMLAEMRRRPEFSEMPVLVLTALPDPLPAEIRNGSTSVHHKPFPLDDFIRYVEETAAHR